MNICIIIVR